MSVEWQYLKRPISWVLAQKAVTALILIITCLLEPDMGYDSSQLLHWPPDAPTKWTCKLATWDGAHYLLLSRDGYKHGSPSCAFYPLWPMLIGTISSFSGADLLLVGLLLANVISVLAVLNFHRYVRDLHDGPTADDATIMLLLMPGAMFFSFVYTESLFFLLITSFFRLLRSEKYAPLSLVCFALPLTKAIGIFCIMPLFWHLYTSKQYRKVSLAIFALLSGYATYFLFMYASTGNCAEGFEAQRFYPNQPSIANILNLPGFARSFFNVHSLHDAMTSSLDGFLFLAFVSSLFLIYRCNKLHFSYALFAGTIPALSTWLFSYTRNVMMCFPLFIVWARAFAGLQNRRFRWCLYSALGGIQALLIVRHVTFRWAG